MSLETESIRSNEVRVPTPQRGLARKVLRYKEERSVILHPDDYRELQALAELLDEACELGPLELSEVGERAHIDEDRPGESLEDPELLADLLR